MVGNAQAEGPFVPPYNEHGWDNKVDYTAIDMPASDLESDVT